MCAALNGMFVFCYIKFIPMLFFGFNLMNRWNNEGILYIVQRLYREYPFCLLLDEIEVMFLVPIEQKTYPVGLPNTLRQTVTKSTSAELDM